MLAGRQFHGREFCENVQNLYRRGQLIARSEGKEEAKTRHESTPWRVAKLVKGKWVLASVGWWGNDVSR